MFLITALGQVAIENAVANNTTVIISNYKLGSNFGYTPVINQMGLTGLTLHTGALEGAVVIDPNNIKYIINLDTSIGHFAFGEIGLFLSNGDMFAIDVLPNPVIKDKAGDTTGTQLGNTIGLEAHLSMYGIYNAISYIPNDSLSLREIKTYPNFDLVPPAANIADYNLVGVTTNRYNQLACTLVRGDLNIWSPVGYAKIATNSTTALSNSTSLITNLDVAFLTNTPGKYLIQFTQGALVGVLREVSSISASGLVTLFSPVSTGVPNGSQFILHQRLETIGGSTVAPPPSSAPVDKSLPEIDVTPLANEYGDFYITPENHTQFMYKLLREKTDFNSGGFGYINIIISSYDEEYNPTETYTPGHWYTFAANENLDTELFSITGGDPFVEILLPPDKISKLRTANSIATLIYLGGNRWILSGDLAESN